MNGRHGDTDVTGIVHEARGGMYVVRDACDRDWLCRTFRGTRTENGDETLVAVGDRVVVRPTDGDAQEEGVIVQVRERSSTLERKRDRRRNRSGEVTQVIASNIDQLVIVASAGEPPLNRRLIDRYLVFSEYAGLPALIVVNKVDLVEEGDLEKELEPYARNGYRTCIVSAESGAGMDQLRSLLSGKISAFSGHSGVGKSTLINRLIGEDRLVTAELSGNSRGVHTTTNAVMLAVPGDGYVIDTPGIREFNLSGITRENLRFWFPEFLEPMRECAYSSCTHTVEPRCGVRQAVEDGRVDAGRYESYCAIFETLEE
ncbi:ribosome small subunit-dependent GTPase A [Prosthecochloris sp. N3]|uniref:Small ribosomal subunit biogenesis GTPase RsgA n=1 Tax=Prosthecochloris ethylica TaxID=2743976 RepID=A0ABR9XNP9_9CHLB|nr:MULTISPECIES: ribosome small subunit-dependent GTPase A [Prosthecochloris]MEC9487351.1 ribosome small subunit-dependent GTPase A [Prosthecochloris sp.]MBF0585683.1 ribosome small subunit-dependent GTPase A [Prosthecochloris ethylica]MBF0635593.1 ribosome small subunit-dependent GTPase A [Prosthecochloris ethylica]NUK46892.1 ribosome small subunit-dependent GTPase A [Prosthecochloris ethylica]RNA65391.1 ribosome small subunit-dependent GTPase A [Prosthecochloris sp. ZM_2]